MTPDVKTSTQIITFFSYNEPTRNLNFRVECKNLEDLQQCVKIIDSYNDFNWKTINKALNEHVSHKVYYNQDNPNNGNDLFTFHIGREGSPVIYIDFNSKLRAKYKIDKTLTQEEFKEIIKNLAKDALADEHSTESTASGITARLWWD